MRIRLRERDPQTRRWSRVLEQRVGVTSCTRIAPLTLNESSELEVHIAPEAEDEWVRPGESAEGPATHFEVRLLLGNVPVASTQEQERPDFLLRWSADTDDGHEYCFCVGRLLRDWVGQTTVRVEVLECGDDWLDTREQVQHAWCPVLQADLFIAAGKMEQETFEALCAEIADYSAGMLLDVYGKTFIGLELERRPGESAPILALQRVRQALDQMGASLRAIARRPAYRLRTERVREPALAEQAVSDLTLEETCLDPTLAVPLPDGSVHFRDQVREVATPTYDLVENRMIAGFLHFLSLQTRDLRARMEHEMRMREDRREYRHRRTSPGAKSWWESEDLPRIEELQGLLQHVSAMGRELATLQRSPFLPPSPPLRSMPQSTPMIRSHKAYSSAFKTMVGHYQAFRVQMDDKFLVMRARSLPVLYEWWCLLEVMRSLRACLPFSQSEDFGPRSPFRRLAEERDRFVVDFAPDQNLDYEDQGGNLIRLRYLPSYVGYRGVRGATYGLLGDERERTPDITLEIFLGGGASNRPPDLIIVLDAKYSSDSHLTKLDEVKRKYGKIGVFKTGKVLSQQVWAMTPANAPPSRARSWGTELPEWATYCTVDNVGFWSDEFDIQSAVAGVVQAKPKMLAGRSPLESLLRLLLKRIGMTIRA